jgi:hypothetical protein
LLLPLHLSEMNGSVIELAFILFEVLGNHFFEVSNLLVVDELQCFTMRVGFSGYLNHEGFHFAGFMLEVLPDRILHFHKLNVQLFFVLGNRLDHFGQFDPHVFCVLTKLLVNYTFLLVNF